jgi:hypothetical protein
VAAQLPTFVATSIAMPSGQSAEEMVRYREACFARHTPQKLAATAALNIVLNSLSNQYGEHCYLVNIDNTWQKFEYTSIDMLVAAKIINHNKLYQNTINNTYFDKQNHADFDDEIIISKFLLDL